VCLIGTTSERRDCKGVSNKEKTVISRDRWGVFNRDKTEIFRHSQSVSNRDKTVISIDRRGCF